MGRNNTTKIFVNLAKAKQFFGKLGFNFNDGQVWEVFYMNPSPIKQD